MRKNLMMGALLFTAAFAGAYALPQSDKYHISGKITGMNEGDTLILTPGASHDRETPIAQTVVKNGQFVFEGSMKEPQMMVLKSKKGNVGMLFMLENCQMQVEATAQARTLQDGSISYDMDGKVIGSPLSNRLDSLLEVRDRMDKRHQEMAERHKEIRTQVYAAYQKKDAEEMKRLSTTDAYKAMSADERSFFHDVDSCYHEVIMANKETYWGPMLMIELSSYLSAKDRATYQEFSQAAKESYYGKKAYAELYPAGNEGEAVKEFTVTDAEGKAVTLKQLLQGKKYLLIDFWASWCGPCRREIPNLKKIYEGYADKGFQIVSISIDKREADWQKALKEEGLAWPNFRSEEVANLYKVKAVPTMYLIDSEGKLVGENLRGEALAKKVEELLK